MTLFLFTPLQLAAHRCEWEPRQCKICGMQIIARDIVRHEEKCANKRSKQQAAAHREKQARQEEERRQKKKADRKALREAPAGTLASPGGANDMMLSDDGDAERCCSFGDCDCRRFVPSTSSRVRPSHPHLICATCGHGALYHQSPDASKALALRSSLDGIKWAKEFQAARVDGSPRKISNNGGGGGAGGHPPPSGGGGVASKIAAASGLRSGGIRRSGGGGSGGAGGAGGGGGKPPKGNVPIRKKAAAAAAAVPGKGGKASRTGGGAQKSALLAVATGETADDVTVQSKRATSALLQIAKPQQSFRTKARMSHDKVHPSGWTVDQVCDWLENHGISEKIRDKFSEQVIDGYMLLNMNQDDLANDLKITRRSDVNKLLAAVKFLKARAKEPQDGEDDGEEDSDSFDDESSDDEVPGSQKYHR